MKYIGSKQKISKDILRFIDGYKNMYNLDTYVEPFVGGANIIDKVDMPYKYGFDIDEIPISIINHFKECPDDLEKLPKEISREEYYKIRDSKDYPIWFKSAILLFASYNSRVYGGCYGAIAKTKDGKVRNYYQEAINNFKKQLPRLKDINFYVKDYRELELNSCLIYCDPPYKNSIKYSQAFNHDEFWQWVRDNNKNNIILVSEYEAPDDFRCIWQQEVKTHLNNRNKLDKVEKLFIWGGSEC